MSRVGLPAGTLGFVFASIAVICASTVLGSDAAISAGAGGNANDPDIESAAPVSIATSAGHRDSVASGAVQRRVSQSSQFESDLRFHGLNVLAALETVFDIEPHLDSQIRSEMLLRRVTRIASNAPLPAAADANASAPRATRISHVRNGLESVREMDDM